jgi:Domain of unknown function (DUF4157)
MKTAALKTNKDSAPSSTTSKPFFSRIGNGSLFAAPHTSESSFFGQPSSPIQRKCAHCEDEQKVQRREEKEDKEKQIQAKNAGNNSLNTNTAVQNTASSGEGTTLPEATKAGMETAFGQDFSNVSIHENSSKAHDLNALAFTQGSHIHFAPGQYDPQSKKGKELLGHELTHVVQQRAGRVEATAQAKHEVVNEDKGLEKEADDMGRKAAEQTSTTGQPAYTNQGSENSSGPLQFRLPTFTDLESVFKDATLAVPESVVIQMITTALLRMEKDGHLLSSDPVPTIISKIFPSPGVIVQAEFDKAVDVTDRNRIYQTVSDTNAPVKAADRGKLKSAMTWAVKICRLTATMDKQLERVFGTKVTQAKDVYDKAGNALDGLKATDAAMDAGINTDYNRDDPAMGLGGWASFSAGIMHLQGDIAEVKDEKRSVITLIHEASHLANPSVDDRGYYPPSTALDAFAGDTEDNKISNAAHFEEFPRRWLGLSAYPKNTVFTPGLALGGGALTLTDKTRKLVSEYFRKAWDAGVDTQFFLRDIKKGELTFSANKTYAMEASQKMDLSIHHQAAGKETVTLLDIALAEGVPRVANKMRKEAAVLPITAPLATDADVPAAAEQVIKDAIAANNTLLNDPIRDKVLLDWLVAHYHAVPTF